MSLMFPTIYGLALDGVEDPAKGGYAGDAKIGASGLIMAILGGALITPLQGMVSDAFGINLAYLVPLVCFIVVRSQILACSIISVWFYLIRNFCHYWIMV